MIRVDVWEGFTFWNHTLIEAAEELRKKFPHTGLGELGVGWASPKNSGLNLSKNRHEAVAELNLCFPNLTHWWFNWLTIGDNLDYHKHSPGTHAAVYYATEGTIVFEQGVTLQCQPGTLIRFPSHWRHHVPTVHRPIRITYACNYSEEE